MTARWNSLVFVCEDIRPIEQFLASIAAVHAEHSPLSVGTLSLLDTMDWNLYQNGIDVTAFESEIQYQLGIQGDDFSLLIDVPKPTHSWLNPKDIVPTYLSNKISEHSSNRVLVAQATSEVTKREFTIVNSQDLPVCEIWLLKIRPISRYCIRIMPRRGFNNAFTTVYKSIVTLLDDLAIDTSEGDPFDLILRDSNRSRNDYANLLSYSIDPNESTSSAIGVALARFAHMGGINRPWIASHPDAEFLHDFRIALRRTSCMMKSFAAILKTIDTTSIESEIKTFARATATTRDLENLGSSIEKFEKLSGHYGQCSRLSDIIAQELNEQYDELSVLTNSPRCDDLILSLARLAKRCSLLNLVTTQSIRWDPYDGKGPIELGPTVPISIAARSIVALQCDSFMRVVSKAKKRPSNNSHHKLRKEIRQFRYLLEFLRSINDGTQATRIISKLKDLQSELGQIQDANIQIELLQQLCASYLIKKSVQKAMTRYLTHQRKQGLAKYKKQIKYFSKSSSLREIQLAFGERK